MKVIFSEFRTDYNKHLFPYQVLLIREPKDKLEKIYQKGFLPFRNNSWLFYLARSCRSNLKNFRLSSENKRIIKKTQGFDFKIISLNKFDFNFNVQKQCKDWSKSRGWKISITSIKNLFQGDFFNLCQLVKEKDQSQTAAYSIIKEEENFVHWAYVFMNPNYQNSNLVIRMGLEIIRWAQPRKKFVYLGTCYGKSNYKRNYPGFEFFNGIFWSKNLKELTWLNENTNLSCYSLQNKNYKEFIQLKKILENYQNE